MVIHIRKGKGGKDRDVLLCPRLLNIGAGRSLRHGYFQVSHETTVTT